jgi:ATP-dependent Clp protease protease subunit
MLIAADHIKRTRDRLNSILAENTGKPIDVIAKDTDRDNWLTAQAALEYGIVDKVAVNRESLK